MKFLTNLILILLIFGYAQALQAENQLKDGTYLGKSSMVSVSVKIEDGKVKDITILEHRGGGDKYLEMILPLKDKIIAEQSIEVDTVTGATVSSEALKEAVEDALKKARK